jgi:outer membrane protein assembly factor BamB
MRGMWTAVTVAGLAAWNGLAAEPVKNAPTFRGDNGSGRYAIANLPTEWNEKDGKNILWKVALDLPGWATPVVWGDKVIALGATVEKRAVWCLDAATGKQTWKTEVAEVEGVTKDHALNTMDARWDGILQAGATPATDGKRVYALFSNGQLVALDLADGKTAWSIAIGDTSGNNYGLTGALLLYKDTVIAVFEGDNKWIAAYDVATGAQKWKTDRKNSTWASPILIKTAGGKDLLVLSAESAVTAWNAADGKEAWSVKAFEEAPQYCAGPSAVFSDGMVCVNLEKNGIFGIDPDKGEQAWDLKKLPDDAEFPDGVSMTTDGKRVFQFFKSALTCVEAKTGKLVKHKEMDISAGYGSPFVSDGKLFLLGSGDALVVNADPAGDFAVLGKGAISDACDGTPAVVEGRFYLRSDSAIYCIGVK